MESDSQSGRYPKWLIALAGLIPSLILLTQPQFYIINDLTRYLTGFATGVIFVAIGKYALSRLLKSRPSSESVDSKIYSLKHGVLNIDVGATQMWMNMGYWKDQPVPRNLPHASRSLLREILLAAGLCSANHTEGTALANSHVDSTVNIVDVGFGCGDQALALQELCGLESYIGLNIDRKQFAFAEQRLKRCGFLTDVAGTSAQDSGRPATVRQVFHADAAKPDVWPEKVKRAVASSCTSSKVSQHSKNWVLGLDVLYHLTPSRLPLFRHAYHDLHASIMAFDLLLPDPQQGRLTKLQTYLLRLVGLVTSTPYSNFLTPAQYRAELVSAGYSENDIEIRDISEYVFGPLVTFLTWQDTQLKTLGLGIGAFHAARWVFGWWARTGIIRGCIIVARAGQ